MKIASQEADGKSPKKREKGGRGRAAPRQRITYKVRSEMLQNDFEEEEEDEEGIIDQFLSSGDDSDWNSDSRYYSHL